jgi:peptidoglycan hydrolase-like protein with peptidoglycan-binding domain
MLQRFLNSKGFFVAQTGPGSPGQETTIFGAKTWQALVNFQKSVGIAPAKGYFGSKTRTYVNNLIP